MASFDLRFQVPGTVRPSAAASIFYWTASGPSSFFGPLGPRLGRLGPVAPANVDLVRIATAVYAADRSVPRAIGRMNWSQRQMELTVPVNDPAAWESVRDDLESLLAFLSGDAWHLTFRLGRPPKEAIAKFDHSQVGRVVLLSGGADSAIGALRARSEQVGHILVSHVGATTVSPIQREVAKQIRDLIPGGANQEHTQITFSRAIRQPGGFEFRDEYSTRTRSFLFLALGLAVASISAVPLWIPENGFASLNPPLGADQRGSLSTRTTHPWFLSELSRIGTVAGAHAPVENPFAASTKGEMFRWAADLLGDEVASIFLSSTDSCAFTNKRFFGIKGRTHCGTCFGCLVRRASFASAGLIDRSTYAVDAPPNKEAGEVLRQSSVRPSIDAFVDRGVRISDIASMRLPAGYSPVAALDLCERGRAELGLIP